MDRRTALQAIAVAPFVPITAVERCSKDRYNLGLYSQQWPKIRANSHLMDFGLSIHDTCQLSDDLKSKCAALKNVPNIGFIDMRQAVWSVIQSYWNTFSIQAGPADEHRFYGLSGETWPTWFVFESMCLARCHGNDLVAWLNGEELKTAEQRVRLIT